MFSAATTPSYKTFPILMELELDLGFIRDMIAYEFPKQALLMGLPSIFRANADEAVMQFPEPCDNCQSLLCDGSCHLDGVDVELYPVEIGFWEA